MAKKHHIYIREAKLSECDIIDQITYKGFVRGVGRKALGRSAGYLPAVKGSAMRRRMKAITFVAVKVQEGRWARLKKKLTGNSHDGRESQAGVLKRKHAHVYEKHQHRQASDNEKSDSDVPSFSEFSDIEDDENEVSQPKEEDGEIVGCVTYASYRSEWASVAEEDEAEVRMLAVTADGAEAAQVLMEHTIKVGRRHQLKRLLTLLPPNVPSSVLGFYKNLGFKFFPARSFEDPLTGLKLTCLKYDYTIEEEDHRENMDEVDEENDLFDVPEPSAQQKPLFSSVPMGLSRPSERLQSSLQSSFGSQVDSNLAAKRSDMTTSTASTTAASVRDNGRLASKAGIRFADSAGLPLTS